MKIFREVLSGQTAIQHATYTKGNIVKIELYYTDLYKIYTDSCIGLYMQYLYPNKTI
jgi:hypothetical protein